MIRPSEVNTAQRFMGTSLGNYEQEVLARNIAVMSQIIAEARKDDRWHPFSQAEYEGVRATTSEERVGDAERAVLAGFVRSEYLTVDEDGDYSVTNNFLEIMVQFASPESVSAVIAD